MKTKITTIGRIVGFESLQDFWRRNRDWYSRPVQEVFDGAKA